MDTDPIPVSKSDSSEGERPRLSEAELTQLLATLPARLRAIQQEVQKCVVGQEAGVEAVFYGLLSRGHCLIEGVPGLGKTLLVRAMSRVLELSFKRVQFTPDLMPADITGSAILQTDDEARRKFVFVRGPIFAQILLADEINRTPPKTQAALLEAMQERTVTVSGHTHHLEEPFLVLATQNPIEQEGTYPLPEAQLDRFLFQVRIGYPTLEEEQRIIANHSYTPLERLNTVLRRDDILALREAVSRIPAAPNVIDYAARLARATRPNEPDGLESVRRWLRCGASPRAGQNLILAGRAQAACRGRYNVACEDVVAVAPLVMRHRLIRSFHAEAEGKSTDDIIAKILEEVPRTG